MKIQFQSKKNQGSAVLLVCLGAAVIIGVAVASYLPLVQAESANVSRSQAWNNSMVMAEGGIEEGMALVNKYVSTGTFLTSWPNTAVTADGWTSLNGNGYHLQRNFGAGYYDVYVTNLNPNVTIKCIGTVVWTNAAVLRKSSQTIARAVLVNVGAESFFQGAILTKNGITLTGNATIDSFNSQDPNYSSNGLYVLSRHEAHGNIMTDASNIVLTVDLTMTGNAHVYGHAYTAPNNAISFSGGATVGDTNFAGPGIQPGWSNSTANIYIPDAPPLPSVSWLPMPTKTNNTYVLNGGGLGQTNYYKIPDSFGNLSGSQQILVTNGTVVLDVEGNFHMSGQSTIDVANQASLVAWFNGNPQLTGQGTINEGGNATNVTFYGTTNCTSLNYSGGSSFIGTIYAPQADVQWTGGTDVFGSLVANSFRDTGGADVHYDENLHGQNSGSYIVTSWAEVPP